LTYSQKGLFRRWKAVAVVILREVLMPGSVGSADDDGSKAGI
jgi:hypothetical protein